jgi:predicted acyltransferase (DUF342 family)
MLAIANLINAGEYEQAERLLNSKEHFEKPSVALANAIMALDRVAVGKPSRWDEKPVSVRKTV